MNLQLLSFPKTQKTNSSHNYTPACTSNNPLNHPIILLLPTSRASQPHRPRHHQRRRRFPDPSSNPSLLIPLKRRHPHRRNFINTATLLPIAITTTTSRDSAKRCGCVVEHVARELVHAEDKILAVGEGGASCRGGHGFVERSCRLGDGAMVTTVSGGFGGVGDGLIRGVRCCWYLRG